MPQSMKRDRYQLPFRLSVPMPPPTLSVSIAMLLDVGGVLAGCPLYNDPLAADTVALMDDWERVGADLRIALAAIPAHDK